MGRVSGTDLLRDAVAELYSADPDQFVERRGALAAAARAAGQAPVARQIAGLRKPTRSAWVVNQLVRAEPAASSELASLGEELRAAQGSLDGAAIRELSQRRRQLIADLARQAFAAAGQPSPPAALRDEVTATLGAALADPQVAEQLAGGTLTRAARSEGFGPAGPPALALVTSSGGRGPGRPARAPGSGRGTGTRARPAQPTAEQAAAERERRRQAGLAAAQRTAADAARAADAATAAEDDLERAVQTLEEQLADARRSLSEIRIAARRARARERQARQALDRLRG
jgi:hypothetical protein